MDHVKSMFLLISLPVQNNAYKKGSTNAQGQPKNDSIH